MGDSAIAVAERHFDIPHAVNTIERSAIDAVLNTYQTYRVILVTAPAGYGKTTAVAQFVRQANVLTVWHSIEERDRDLSNLQFHIVRALSTIAPGIEHVLDPALTPRECAIAITNYLRDQVDAHFLLVLDDLHVIAGALHTEAWLQALVELLPSRCHLVLIGRTIPDLPLAELIAKGAITAIGQDKLRFSEDEAAAFARVSGGRVTQTQVKQRVAQLEGWPAGVAMALQPLPKEVEMRILGGQQGQGPEALFYTLADIMLQKQTPVLRDFLLASSVLTRLTPELCVKILNLPQSLNSLGMILNRGLFVTQVAGGFIYHRLFRSFLQTQLRHKNPELYTELHGRAGDWYRDQGDIETAFEHYIAAGLIDDALMIVENAHMAYFSQGKVETLLMWRSKLGESANRIPYLLYKCSIIYTERYLYGEAEEELALASAAFERSPDLIGLADVELQLLMIMGRRGEFQQVIAKVEALLEQDALPDRIIARAKHQLALSYLELGDTARAIGLLEVVLPTFQENQDLHALSNVLQDMEVAYTKRGDFDSASQCLQQVVSIKRQLRRPDALALALNNLGYHYHQRHHYKEAIATLEEGLGLVEQTADHRVESYLLWTLGDIRRDLGEFELAQNLYDNAYELSSGMEPSLQRGIALSMSTLYRWQGDCGLAERIARETTEPAPPSSSPDILLAQAKRWIAHASHADVCQALNEMDSLLEQLETYSTGLEYRLCALYCAAACLLLNDAIRADAYLAETFMVGATTQNPYAPEIVAEIMNSPLLTAHIRRSPKAMTVMMAVENLRSEGKRPDDRMRLNKLGGFSGQTYALQVDTLGDEAIIANDIPVRLSAWRANRAREFFLYLLLEGGQTREAISLAFWPDSSTSRVRSNFHTTLYRARQALSENVVIFEDEKYRINPEIDVTCDAIIMEECVKQARFLQPVDVRADELFRKALRLYKGDFLPSLDASWVDARRRRMFELYMESLLGAGQCARARRDYREAIALYHRGLEHDPYRESVHRAMFICYAELGEMYQVMNHYQTMERIFKADLGIMPSPETQTLLQTLI